MKLREDLRTSMQNVMMVLNGVSACSSLRRPRSNASPVRARQGRRSKILAATYLAQPPVVQRRHGVEGGLSCRCRLSRVCVWRAGSSGWRPPASGQAAGERRKKSQPLCRRKPERERESAHQVWVHALDRLLLQTRLPPLVHPPSPRSLRSRLSSRVVWLRSFLDVARASRQPRPGVGQQLSRRTDRGHQRWHGRVGCHVAQSADRQLVRRCDALSQRRDDRRRRPAGE